jgi:hypothetical protein
MHPDQPYPQHTDARGRSNNPEFRVEALRDFSYYVARDDLAATPVKGRIAPGTEHLRTA